MVERHLVIRDEQLAVLEAEARRRFVDRAVAHVAKVFPAQCAALDERAVRARVEAALARAAGRGLASERAATLYVDLDFGLGPDFEERPDCAWLRRVLDHPEHSDAMKMHLIYRDLPKRVGPAGPTRPAGEEGP